MPRPWQDCVTHHNAPVKRRHQKRHQHLFIINNLLGVRRLNVRLSSQIILIVMLYDNDVWHVMWYWYEILTTLVITKKRFGNSRNHYFIPTTAKADIKYFVIFATPVNWLTALRLSPTDWSLVLFKSFRSAVSEFMPSPGQGCPQVASACLGADDDQRSRPLHSLLVTPHSWWIQGGCHAECKLDASGRPIMGTS